MSYSSYMLQALQQLFRFNQKLRLELSVFFFQAEDGIRDGHVTGVQTCALPISAEGRERLQEIIAAIGAMMLGETDADMRDALQTIVQGLGQITQAAPAGEDRTSRSVQYLRTITEFQGQEIVLILDALEHWARQQLAQLEIIAGHTAALAGLEAAVQSAMAGAMPSFDAATIESLTSNRTINLRFGDLNLTRALSDPEDVDTLAEAFAHRFRDILRERY